jgi:hypothetical protein
MGPTTQVPITVATAARVLTFNMRLANYALDLGSRRWTRRRQYVLEVIERAAPSIIGFQECNGPWQSFIETELGDLEWARFGTHPVQLFINVSKWQVLNWWERLMPSGLRKRYFVAAHLKSIKTGGTFLACNTHLAAGGVTEPSSSNLRHAQMHMIGRDFLPTLPDHEKVVIMVDLNSDGQNEGVRAVAAQYGLGGLRRRLSPDPPSSRWRSFNGWKPTQLGGQIDDILAGRKVMPYTAELRLACTRVYPVVASDHNAWSASVKFDTVLEPAPLP